MAGSMGGAGPGVASAEPCRSSPGSTNATCRFLVDIGSSMRACRPLVPHPGIGPGNTAERRLRLAKPGEASQTAGDNPTQPHRHRAPAIHPEVATRSNWHGPCRSSLVSDIVNRRLDEPFVARGTRANIGGDLGSSRVPASRRRRRFWVWFSASGGAAGGSAGRSGSGATIPMR
jgi:hypothetical protein